MPVCKEHWNGSWAVSSPRMASELLCDLKTSHFFLDFFTYKMKKLDKMLSKLPSPSAVLDVWSDLE